MGSDYIIKRRELLRIDHRPKIVALMSLSPGHKLAHYEIVESVGSGGMDSPLRVKGKPSS